jgi:hypothetical protein
MTIANKNPLLKNISSIMDMLRGTEKNLKQIAGAIGVIQSLAWIIMAVICIVLYYTEPTDSFDRSYMDQVEELFYQLFLKRYNQRIYFDGQSLTPAVFAFFSWVYLFIDLTWFATSWLVLLQRKGNLRLIYQIWTANTALVCLIDLIVVIILGADYDKCLSDNLEGICVNGILPVLVIAAKGFILWIVNAIFVVVVWKISKKLQQETPLSHFMPRSTLQGSPNVGPPFQQQYLGGYQYNSGSPVPARFPPSPYSPAVPTTPYSPAVPTTPYFPAVPPKPFAVQTVPRSPVRQSWSGYTQQVPTQQPYRQYQEPFVLRAPPRRY